MPELDEERLERLRGWKADLEKLIAQATRAGDTQVAGSAKAMLHQCETFIAEAEGRDSSSG